MIMSCWSFGSESNTCFDMITGSSMYQYDLPRPEVRLLAISSSRNEIRLVEDVMPASHAPVCMAAFSSFDGIDSVVAPAACRTMSISRLPPRIFRPLQSSGLRTAADRLATPPACQIHATMMTPFSAKKALNFWPIGDVFHAAPCL